VRIPIAEGWIEGDENAAAALTRDEHRWVPMRFTAQEQLIGPFVTDFGHGPGVVMHPEVEACWSSAQALQSQVEAAGEQLGVMLIPTTQDLRLFHRWEWEGHTATAGTPGFYEPVLASDPPFVAADRLFVPWGSLARWNKYLL